MRVNQFILLLNFYFLISFLFFIAEVWYLNFGSLPVGNTEIIKNHNILEKMRGIDFVVRKSTRLISRETILSNLLYQQAVVVKEVVELKLMFNSIHMIIVYFESKI